MTGERPQVHSVAVELTDYCNQACSHCYNAERTRERGSVPANIQSGQLPRIRRLLERLELDHITLTGGEPFACNDLFETLALLRERGVPAQIISNGTLVTEELARRLADYQPRAVQITLNGPDRELHEQHVGKGYFEATLGGIRALKRHQVRVVGCIVVTKLNAARIAETLELWQTLGVRQVALSRFSPAGHAAGSAGTLLPTRSELIGAFEQAVPFARDRGLHLSCTMPVPPCAMEVKEFAPIRFGTCSIGTPVQEFALGTDGALRNCTLQRRAIGEGPDIVDPSVDLAQLIRSEDVTQYKGKLPEFCEGCLYAPSCAGGCLAAAEWLTGEARAAPDPFLWQHVDDDFAAQLKQERRKHKSKLPVVS